MHVWIVLFSLLLVPAPETVAVEGVRTDDEPLRYRGIEALLAKFDAQASDDGAPPG